MEQRQMFTSFASGDKARSRMVAMILVFLFLNGLCDGALMTVLAVYIAEIKGLGFKGVSLFYTSFGVASVVTSLITTSKYGNISLKKRAYLGAFFLAVGYPIVSQVTDSNWLFIPGGISGAGMSLYVSALIGCLNELATPDTRRHVFSQRNLYVNAGQCAGSILVGGLIHLFGAHVAGFFLLYKLFCMLAFGGCSWLFFNRTKPHLETSIVFAEAKIPEKKTNFHMIIYALAFNFLVTMVVVGQVDTVVPLIATQLMSLQMSQVSFIIVSNTLTVVLLQAYISKITHHIDEGKLLTFTAWLWVLSYLWCLLGVSLIPNEPVLILVVFSIINGIGQCIFSSCYYPYISKAASPSDFKRFSSGSSAAFNSGRALGLSFSGFALATQNIQFIWVYLSISCFMIFAFSALYQLYINRLSYAGLISD